MGLYSLLQSSLEVTSPMLRLANFLALFWIFRFIVLDHQDLVPLEKWQLWRGPRGKVGKHILYIFLAIENKPQQSAKQSLDLFIGQSFCDASFDILRSVMGE